MAFDLYQGKPKGIIECVHWSTVPGGVTEAYQYMSGPKVEQLGEITPHEQKLLLELALKFHNPDAEPEVKEWDETKYDGEDRPGDYFNAHARWDELLEEAGYHLCKYKGQETWWTRPGGSDVTCTVNHNGSNLLHCFSANDPAFEKDTAYTPFTAFAKLFYGGDHSAAARHIHDEGFGSVQAFHQVKQRHLTALEDEIEKIVGRWEPHLSEQEPHAAEVVKDHHAGVRDMDSPETTGLAHREGSKFDRLAVMVRDDMLRRREYPLFHRGVFYTYQSNRYVEETDSELAHRIRTFLRKNGLAQSNNIIGNVAPIIQNMGHRPVAVFGEMPFFTGTGPWPKIESIVAYRNGLLDLDRYLAGDFGLISHTPKWASAFCLPHNFEPKATCPTWERFLDEVFEGDEARLNLLQEFFGYSLTHDTSHQKALVQIGKKRSGKGTCQAVLQELLGEANWSAFQLGMLVKDFGLSPLINRLVAFVGEVELSGNPHKGEILERLKGIIGEDPQTVNQKHKPLQTFKLPIRFVIACNEMPHFWDASRAISSRFLFLAYQRSFAGQEDTGLRDKMRAEISGINNWALQGLTRLKRQGGFTLPETHKSLLDDFDRGASPVAAFIEDCLAIQWAYYPGDLPKATVVDEPLWIERERCYQLYESWCVENSISASNRAYFGQDLRTLLPKVPDKNSKQTVNGVQKRVYRGIGMKPEMTQ
jgi:putative DNA primase/helicase